MALALVATPPVGPERDENEYQPDLGTYRKWFRAFESNKEDEIEEQRVARRYYHTKQWTSYELEKFKDRKQPVITDNRLARKIDSIVGVEQRMRRDPKAYPRTPKEAQSADVATACLRYACDAELWEQKASEAAHDGFTSGIGVIWIGIEPGEKGNEVRMKPVDVDRFFYDPRSVRADFSDARFMGVHLWMDIADAKAKWPDHAEALQEVLDNSNGMTSLASEEDRAEQWGDFEAQRVRVVELYECRPQFDPQLGRVVKPWHYCMFTGDLKLEGDWSPYLTLDGVPDNPYIAWTARIDEKGVRYGEVRVMRPMQDEINHRRSKFLHMVNTRQFYYREGDIEDVDEFAKELTKPDGKLKHTGEWGVTVGIIDQMQEMRGQAELLAQAEAALENYGPNPGLTGKGGGVQDQSGRAILAQRDSGLTELSPVFDRLRGWKLRCYRTMWARIRQAWTEERYIAITDDPRAPEFIGLNQYGIDPMSGQITGENVIAQIDVDIILDEGPDTIIMQEEMMQTLAQLGEAAVGPLGKVLIELSNMPNKDQLLKLMDSAAALPPEVVQMQERLAKLEELLKATEIDKNIVDVEKGRAEVVKTLAESMAPPQVMQAFPLQYGGPTVRESLMGAGQQAPQPLPPPDAQPQIPGPVPDMPPDNALMPPPEAMPMGGPPGM